MRTWTSADFDSVAKSASRLSRNPARLLSSETRLWSKPACPAGLRNRIVSPAMRRDLATEDQAENEPDAERGENGLRRVFANVLLAVFLQSADTVPRIFPDLFGFILVFLSHRARGRFQILRHHAGGGPKILRGFADVGLAAFEFILGGCWNGSAAWCGCLVFFSHGVFLSILFRSLGSLRLFDGTHALMISPL